MPGRAFRQSKDPETTVLDTDCKARGVDDLHVTDASFFPSTGKVNPILTIVAVFNATGVRVRDFPITMDKLLPGLPENFA